MSSKRVITGTDDRGRPISEWRPVTDDPGPAYAFMEPAHSAPIERRRATPEELAAARAREDEPDHLVAASVTKPPTVAPFDPDRDQASRLRGGAVTAELNRKQDRPKPQPSPEEPVVSEAGHVMTTEIPQITVGAAEANGEYLALADAAREVAYADAAAQAAQEALHMARERLATALAGVGLATPRDAWTDALGDPAFRSSLDEGLADVEAGRVTPVKPKPARIVRRGSNAHRAADVDKRGRLVLETLERHGGNTKAAGAELGMRGNIVALIAKRAAKREAVSV